MAEVERISVHEAREKVRSNAALLVCAYDDEEKYNKMKLEGAIPLARLEAQAATLPKDREIIFYCG
jgi:rhodanese-related sulfurtransferase